MNRIFALSLLSIILFISCSKSDNSKNEKDETSFSNVLIVMNDASKTLATINDEETANIALPKLNNLKQKYEKINMPKDKEKIEKLEIFLMAKGMELAKELKRVESIKEAWAVVDTSVAFYTKMPWVMIESANHF